MIPVQLLLFQLTNGKAGRQGGARVNSPDYLTKKHGRRVNGKWFCELPAAVIGKLISQIDQRSRVNSGRCNLFAATGVDYECIHQKLVGERAYLYERIGRVPTGQFDYFEWRR